MPPQELQSETRPDPVPADLESAQAKLVYLCLDVVDGATVDELQRVLTMQKIDILSILQSLSGDGLVEQSGDEYVVDD